MEREHREEPRDGCPGRTVIQMPDHQGKQMSDYTHGLGRQRAVSIAAAASIAVFASMLTAPRAEATEDAVTYEIVSDSVGHADIVYMDPQARAYVRQAALPWRMDTAVWGGIERAEVRADWRPFERPNKWVTVRILVGGKVICQSTLDIGNATCYGNTPHIF
jgi:hypothetical protein